MDVKTNKKDKSSARSGTLGTFAGVFTPSILTILGIILFMRLGYVVGNAGLWRALIILVFANGISVLTTISLSAIATNLKVKGGGDYYLISRTLGLEFGGAIGIVLYLAQSVSIAFYCIGFGEVLAGVLGSDSKIMHQIIAALAVSFLFIFVWFGADVATRFQYVVMTILGIALISFFWGGFSSWDHTLLTQNWGSPSPGMAFWGLFAIFFPAVTGFTQGVSMSGDLRDPGRSLPLGTFLAVGISIIVYFLAALTFAASTPGDILRGDYGVMRRVAAVDFLITAGVVAATLSSAMASYLGAPRILQSLASDRIFPFLLPFAKGYGPAGNPRRGVLLSTAIAFATIALGNLNVIAPVVSMFFLISYGLLNYATYYEARAASPSFRPRFRWYDLRASFLGALACLGVMLAIDLTAGLIAITILFAIFQYLKRTAGPARWADSRRSYHLQQARNHLLSAATEAQHPRDWRPHLLLFSNDSHRRKHLLNFASWLEGDAGLTTVVRILEGRGVKMLKLKEESETELQKDIIESGLEAFPLVITVPEFNQGLQTLVQAFGVGPLRANTILLNWIEQLSERKSAFKEMLYGRQLKTAFRMGCNLIVLNAKQDQWENLDTLPPNKRRIDVWWWADATSRLMLLLAHIMTRSETWEEAIIRVLAVGDDTKTERTTEELQITLNEVRIEAQPEIVRDANTDIVAAYSADTALVFLPLRLRGDQPLDPFGNPLEHMLSRLPIAALVLAAEDIELDAEPEEGIAAEVASALDAVQDAEKKVQMAEKDVSEASEAAEKAKEKLQKGLAAEATTLDEETLSELIKELRKAERQSVEASRRYAKAKTKAKAAAREAEALGAVDKNTKKETNSNEDKV
ncbi:MAG: amino acid permease [Deltaproteobacteria bacterium]|nr:MAG: amino acid permease [Deltaproteobacteria bacterium]